MTVGQSSRTSFCISKYISARRASSSSPRASTSNVLKRSLAHLVSFHGASAA